MPRRHTQATCQPNLRALLPLVGMASSLAAGDRAFSGCGSFRPAASTCALLRRRRGSSRKPHGITSHIRHVRCGSVCLRTLSLRARQAATVALNEPGDMIAAFGQDRRASIVAADVGGRAPRWGTVTRRCLDNGLVETDMSKAMQLRNLLRQDGMTIAPGAYDCITATLIAHAGFPAVY